MSLQSINKRIFLKESIHKDTENLKGNNSNKNGGTIKSVAVWPIGVDVGEENSNLQKGELKNGYVHPVC